jgi:hypothetical protein
MLKAAIPSGYDYPVYDWTGEELPMSGVVYQVGTGQYYTADQLSDAKDANFNAQAWAWTEIGLNAAGAAAGAVKGISVVGKAGGIAKPININLADIKYTQTSAGRGKIDLYNSIKNNGYNSKYPIDVVKTEVGFTTVDNTRPAIMQSLGKTEIPAVIHAPSESLPASMNGRFGNATTWGEAISNRTANQIPQLPPTGTNKIPKLLLDK